MMFMKPMVYKAEHVKKVIDLIRKGDESIKEITEGDPA